MRCGHRIAMGQAAYYAIVIALGVANVVLAAIAYGQRARQLSGAHVPRSQLALAEERNRMAAERIDRLDAQVALLTSIRDSVAARPADVVPEGAGRCVGVIDVGSTTVRMVVVTAGSDGRVAKTIGDERAFLHLGAEVERDGRYSPLTLKRAASRVAAFQHLASSLGCEELAIVLTAPGRRGANPDALVDAIVRAAGAPVTALSAGDEARLTFSGAAPSASNPGQRLVVCDVGGGSTELAAGSLRDGVDATCCLDVGALSLAERHFAGRSPSPQELDAARATIDRHLDGDRLPAGEVLIATGGSAHALARISGTVVDADAAREALELSTRLPKRVAKRLHPQRRRSLAAGVLLLSVIQERLDLPLTVSRGGLREGVIRHLLDDPRGPLAGQPRAGRLRAV